MVNLSFFFFHLHSNYSGLTDILNKPTLSHNFAHMDSPGDGTSVDTCLCSLSANCSSTKDDGLFSRNVLDYHLGLLDSAVPDQKAEEASMAPMLSTSVLKHDATATNQEVRPKLSQFGLLAGLSHVLESSKPRQKSGIHDLYQDPRLLLNVSTPSSTFICGSQGSGKSHTLSCMLENCLIPSKVGQLPNPLTGVVFHYDAFISDKVGSPCEAAFLSSHPDVDVRVLCSPTNIRSIRVRVPLLSPYYSF